MFLFVGVLMGGAAAGLVLAQNDPPKVAAAPLAEARNGRPVYELRTLHVGETYETIRFRVATGQAWLAIPGINGNVWLAIRESDGFPSGDFEVQMTQTKPGSYTVLRIDQLSGSTWSMTADRQWKIIGEPQAAKAEPPK
jgi:hypothetical protein